MKDTYIYYQASNPSFFFLVHSTSDPVYMSVWSTGISIYLQSSRKRKHQSSTLAVLTLFHNTFCFCVSHLHFALFVTYPTLYKLNYIVRCHSVLSFFCVFPFSSFRYRLDSRISNCGEYLCHCTYTSSCSKILNRLIIRTNKQQKERPKTYILFLFRISLLFLFSLRWASLFFFCNQQTYFRKERKKEKESASHFFFFYSELSICSFVKNNNKNVINKRSFLHHLWNCIPYRNTELAETHSCSLTHTAQFAASLQTLGTIK